VIKTRPCVYKLSRPIKKRIFSVGEVFFSLDRPLMGDPSSNSLKLTGDLYVKF